MARIGTPLGDKLGCPMLHPDTPCLPQVPKSRQVLGACDTGVGESSALLGGPVPRRWRPRCWVDARYWVSPTPDMVTPPS